ncbi:MAG TPA: cation diffusion facilitator family transporter [Polyangiaceae bacterium]|jgi:cobalt-zinc-cadmium efflux system protein|nr:cation diffusion facilitator family transporter [Polyangiaceae bacterium]
MDHDHHGHAHAEPPGHGHAHARAETAGHGHGHGNHGHGADASSGALRTALFLTTAFMFVEAIYGLRTHGLSLLADAAHMLADAGSLGLALAASEWAKRPRTAKSTFGHRRAEVLAAFVNGIALAVTAIGITIEAVERWAAPREILAFEMLLVAALGLVMNLLVAFILSRAQQGMNVRAALAHVVVDALGSIGAMSAAGFVLAFGWTRADSVVSIGISLLVAFTGWRVLRETTGILLEAAPRDIDVAAVEREILCCGGVAGVHDLHVWRISDRFDALTVHVTLADGSHGVEVCRDVAKRLEEKFGIEHVTVQPEAPPPVEIVCIRSSRDGRRLAAP